VKQSTIANTRILPAGSSFKPSLPISVGTSHASSVNNEGATLLNSSNQLRNLVFRVINNQSLKKGYRSDLDQAIAVRIIPNGDVDRYKSFVGVDLGMRKGETRNLDSRERGDFKSSSSTACNLTSFLQNWLENLDQSGKNLERSLPESVIEENDNFPGNSITL
jgi:hypothetical protein